GRRSAMALELVGGRCRVRTCDPCRVKLDRCDERAARLLQAGTATPLHLFAASINSRSSRAASQGFTRGRPPRAQGVATSQCLPIPYAGSLPKKVLLHTPLFVTPRVTQLDASP